MKIGVFDSGLGGLSIAQAIMARLPQYDYIYLGDTKRVPYGNRSQDTIHEFVGEALDYLFANDCLLVILACNTASAESLRKSQQEYLPAKYPDRKVLGVLIPAVESAVEIVGQGKIGVLATASTVDSGSYQREVQRRAATTEAVCVAAPLLVPLVECDGLKYVEPILADYLRQLGNTEVLILGCTHYGFLKDQIRSMVDCPVVCPDEVVPDKLAEYLVRHKEIERRLSKGAIRRYLVTDLAPGYAELAGRLAGAEIPLELVTL
jgi:glutamate racemase